MPALGIVVIGAVFQRRRVERVLAEMLQIANRVAALQESIFARAVQRVIFRDVPGLFFSVGFFAALSADIVPLSTKQSLRIVSLRLNAELSRESR